MPKALQVKNLAGFDNLVHAFFPKEAGNVDFKFASKSKVLQCRSKILSQLDIKKSSLYEADQIHGSNIQTLTKDNHYLFKSKLILKTDGFLTNLKNVFLMIKTADCFPVLFFDPKNQVVGIVHAGWRGVMEKIHWHMLFKMKNKFKSDLKNILIAIGPGVNSCCFAMANPVQSNLVGWQKFCKKTPSEYSRYSIDLLGFLKSDLLKAGIKKEHIESLDICTCCNPDFFSHTRSKKTGEEEGRFPSIIGIRES